jgi:hypothetical protein
MTTQTTLQSLYPLAREGKYPPAKPGALRLGPLKAAVGVANATLGGLTRHRGMPQQLKSREPKQ